MKRKIIYFIAIFTLAFAAISQAQQKPLDLSIKAYGGYGLLTPGGDTYILEVGSSDNRYSQGKIGLGQGMHAGAGIQLNLSKTISVGIDADYLTGSKHNSALFNNDSTKLTTSLSHSVFSFIPNISFKLLSKPGYSIYNTIGVIAAVKTKVDYENGSINYSDNVQYTSTQQDNNKYGLMGGFRDAFGVQFNLVKNIKGFAEVNGYFLPVSPSSTTRTLSTGAGSDGTAPLISVYHITYKTSGTTAESSTGNGYSYTTSPSVQHISSIGINIGVIVPIH